MNNSLKHITAIFLFSLGAASSYAQKPLNLFFYEGHADNGGLLTAAYNAATVECAEKEEDMVVFVTDGPDADTYGCSADFSWVRILREGATNYSLARDGKAFVRNYLISQQYRPSTINLQVFLSAQAGNELGRERAYFMQELPNELSLLLGVPVEVHVFLPGKERSTDFLKEGLYKKVSLKNITWIEY